MKPVARPAGGRAKPTLSLEVELEDQLDHPWRADGVRDSAEVVRVRDVARGRTKARLVQRVEDLDPELAVARTPDVDPLREHEIDVGVARRSRDADRAVP